MAGAVVRFDANCRFVFKEIKYSPQTITPGELQVINMRNGEEFVVPDIRQLPFSGGEMISYGITLIRTGHYFRLICEEVVRKLLDYREYRGNDSSIQFLTRPPGSLVKNATGCPVKE